MTEPKLDYAQRLTLGVNSMQGGKHSGKVMSVDELHDDDCGVFIHRHNLGCIARR